MICSSVNLLFLMSAILLVGGLLLLQVGMAGRGHVSPANRAGAAGGMLAMARILGWCLGSALVAVVFALVHERPTVTCLVMACGFASFGAIVSVSRSKAMAAPSAH